MKVPRFLSVQDGRAMLSDGKPVVDTASDSLALVELSGGKLILLHQTAVPASLVGPPGSVAVNADGTLALITAATQLDPNDPQKVVPADIVSVIALDPSGMTAPQILKTLHTGFGASGVSINQAGTLALVANRRDGSVSVLTIDGSAVEVLGKVVLGDMSGPSHVAFTPDGRSALVTREGDNRISVLEIEGQQVTLAARAFCGTSSLCARHFLRWCLRRCGQRWRGSRGYRHSQHHRPAVAPCAGC